MNDFTEKSILIGNGFNINFGGDAYKSEYIIKRIIFNARANKYDELFDHLISGDEIAEVFFGLAEFTNNIVKGKFDNLIKGEDIPVLEDFKLRYNWDVKHYYEVGLEDWFFLLRVYFLERFESVVDWPSLKEGFDLLILDAIYNDGDIQTIHKKIGKPVKKWLKGYRNIFTVNYDNNIEALTRKPVFHLHGDYRTSKKSKQMDIIPRFKHCYCNALLDYSGDHKYKTARNTDTEYHFKTLENLIGEIHIIGMSPNNDGHIFRLIDESEIEKVVFYYYSDSETKNNLPVHQKIKYEKASNLWKGLNASAKCYNHKYNIPDYPDIDKFLDLFNKLSGDPISKDNIIKGVNAIPLYQAQELCKLVAQKLSEQSKNGPPKDEADFYLQFREISRIALRHGVLPTALFVHYVMKDKAVKI